MVSKRLKKLEMPSKGTLYKGKERGDGQIKFERDEDLFFLLLIKCKAMRIFTQDTLTYCTRILRFSQFLLVIIYKFLNTRFILNVQK